MAFAGIFLGSLIGVLSFGIGIAFLDFGFLQSLLVYTLTGTATALCVIAINVLRALTRTQGRYCYRDTLNSHS